MSHFDLLSSPLVEWLGWALLHTLWQALSIALLLAVTLLFLRHRSANSRYLVSFAALFLTAVCIPVTMGLVGRTTDVHSENLAVLADPVADDRPGMSAAAERASATDNPSASIEPQELVGPAPTSPAAPTLPNDAANRDRHNSDVAEDQGHVPPSTWTFRDQLAWLVRFALPWICLAWLAGLLLLFARHTGAWISLWRLKTCGTSPVPAGVQNTLDRLVERWRIRGCVRALESSRCQVPAMIGVLRPVILLPGTVLTGLTPQELEAVLAHELAHIRRFDFLMNILQTAIETLLFYHPAVWWISRRIRDERENCCDDLALSVTDDRLLYARSLARLEETCRLSPAGASAPLTLAADGGSLLSRIRRILGHSQKATLRERVSAVCGACSSGAIVIAVATFLFLSAGSPAYRPKALADEKGEVSAPTKEPTTTQTASKETDFKAIDIGSDWLHIEAHPSDQLSAGLIAVGFYPTREKPHAKWIYEAGRQRSIPGGYVELVGRLPGSQSPSDRFEVERFERNGSKITAVIARYEAEADDVGPRKAIYVHANLPTLPPGKYAAEVSLRDYRSLGDRFEPADKVRDTIACTFLIPSNDESAAELKRLTEAAIAITAVKPFSLPRSGSDQNPTGLDYSRILRLTGQDKDRAAFSDDHLHFRRDIHRLARERRTWALCSLLDHESVDAKILAVRAMAELGDADAVAPMLAASKKNNHFVSGSENATLHSIYRSTLKSTLQKITGDELTPKGLKLTTLGTDGKPRVIRSDESPEYFVGDVDFTRVENWLRRVYLAENN